MLLICLCAVFAVQLAPHDPNAMDLMNMAKPPAWMEGAATGTMFWEQTTSAATYSRMLYGSQISLVVGILATLMSGAVGMVLGLISGYYGGVTDHVIMRVADAFTPSPASCWHW